MSQLLLVRHGGLLWGVASRSVREVVARSGGLGVALPGGVLAVPEVVAVQRELAVAPVPAALLRSWPLPCLGLAVCDGAPVVVLDPEHPPTHLLEQGDASHGPPDL